VAITNDLLSKIRQAHSRLHRAYEELKHRRRELTDDKARTKTAGAAKGAGGRKMLGWWKRAEGERSGRGVGSLGREAPRG
jgi:hypothetical protein